MKLRAVRGGQFVEFEHEDLGEVYPGVFRSIFMINGVEWPTDFAAVPGRDRIESDENFLVIALGFERGSLSYWDGSGWAPLRTPPSGPTVTVLGGPQAPAIANRPASIAPGRITLSNKRPPFPGPVQRAGVLPVLRGHGLSAPRLLKADATIPDTMGWRAWIWQGRDELLMSPHQGTTWATAQLAADHWSDDEAVRGEAGIHARLVPRHWKIIGWPDDETSSGIDGHPHLVTGIVERFGRYVLGTEGWRAEQVVIRELMAPSTEVGLGLEQRYPDVIVHYPDQVGEVSCESVKSSALGKGSRMLLPSLSPPSSLPSPPPPILRAAPLVKVTLSSPPDAKQFPLRWLANVTMSVGAGIAIASLLRLLFL